MFQKIIENNEILKILGNCSCELYEGTKNCWKKNSAQKLKNRSTAFVEKNKTKVSRNRRK